MNKISNILNIVSSVIGIVTFTTILVANNASGDPTGIGRKILFAVLLLIYFLIAYIIYIAVESWSNKNIMSFIEKETPFHIKDIRKYLIGSVAFFILAIAGFILFNLIKEPVLETLINAFKK